VDRCALFVDAGYVLADGALAVHGTRQRGSVSWDYGGLVKLLTGLSRDRTGLPVLRCYWYEAVEGRRNAEHEKLADLPGLKLRLGRIRPGRREGVETEMHRDLATLARNHAISDAVIVSAEEDLAEIITEVQDLGMRVVIVHIPVDGNWAISGPLREECDDIVEVSGAHLRPFVDLLAGAEPAEHDEQYSNGSYQPRSLEARSFETRDYPQRGLNNGHGVGIGAVTHQGLPAAALPAPPTIYTAPVVEEYQRTAQPYGSGAAGPGSMGSGAIGPDPMGSGPVTSSPSTPTPPAAQSASAAAGPPAPAPTAPAVPPRLAGPFSAAESSPQAALPHHGGPSHQADSSAQLGSPARIDPRHQGGLSAQVGPAHQVSPAHQAGHGAMIGEQGAPHGSHALALGPAGEFHAADAARNTFRPRETDRQGSHAAQPMAQASMSQAPAPQAPPPSAAPQPPGPGGVPFGHHQGEYRSAEQLGSHSGLPVREVPAREGPGLHDGMAAPGGEAGRSGGPAAARFADVSVPPPSASAHSGPAQPMSAQHMPAQPVSAQQMPGQQYPSTPPGQFGGGPPHQPYRGSVPGQPATSVTGSGYSSPQHDQGQGPYSGPQSSAHSQVSHPVPQPMTVSLADAVQAAHAEGFGFGDAVARDAPALWLEAVLARKPRMPSDLEARLLQGSALPIDSLLHDEVRHSLRRGFWDALERSRR
jgi:hypothetical protein